MTHTPSTQDVRPANPSMIEWLAKQYDQPQHVNCGPEALAWDLQALQPTKPIQPSFQPGVVY